MDGCADHGCPDDRVPRRAGPPRCRRDLPESRKRHRRHRGTRSVHDQAAERRLPRGLHRRRHRAQVLPGPHGLPQHRRGLPRRRPLDLRLHQAFGSFWSGIKLIAINPSTGLRADNSIVSIAGRGGGPIEAPFIFRHGAYYYLYVSFDYCCRGASSNYRIMVGRSTSVTGPYYDRNGVAMTSGGGTELLASHGSIHGPGGEGVFTDTDHDILDYHYYADDGTPQLGINWLGYDSAGWPYVF
ncbi:arabinan endo-1,5-alpha-L-arabinosidase [Actinoallomurus sp. NPDC052308]|uniref:arabinan endo-1,5-alpha-L-arabinosidase n=1 Tax=Actinoallomurus sp. NPDC052308 TaxID=3155530 RepID=UPI0034393276